MKGLKIVLLGVSVVILVGSLSKAAVFEDNFESAARGWKSKHYKDATMCEVVAEGKHGGSCYKISGGGGDIAFQYQIMQAG